MFEGASNPNWRGGTTIAFCQDCGVRISKYHKRCKSCARKKELHPNWKGDSRRVCIDCGKRLTSREKRVKRCLDCWYKFNTKANNPAWNGGTSFAPYSPEFNATLKKLIRERDNYTCQECEFTEGQLGYPLRVHHIDYDKMNSNPTNLISLCNPCHGQTNFERGDWERYFKEKMN